MDTPPGVRPVAPDIKMTVDLDRIAEDLLANLRAQVNAERAEFVKGYAPTSEEILGVSTPATRKAAMIARTAVMDENVSTRVDLAMHIITLGFLETRQAAYELLAKDASRLTRRQLDHLAKGLDNWATVDSFATTLAGRAWLAGRIDDADVAAWARSKDPWKRRTALASTVALNVPARGGRGDTKRTIAVCEILADDEHRLVQKALSWSLRSLVRWDAAAVGRFLDRHRDLPAFVVREVAASMKKRRSRSGQSTRTVRRDST